MSTATVSPADRLDTLPAGQPELTLGFEVAQWMGENLIQPNGPRARQPFEVTFDQFRFLIWWYALDEDGRWLFNHGVRRRAKGPITHDTPVMTPDGWSRHGDLRVGDRVFAADGSITTVTALGDEVLGPCYRLVFRDGSSVVCTGDHRWPMAEFEGNRRIERVVTVREMLAKGVVYGRKLTGGRTKARRGGVARWCSMPSPAIGGVEVDYPIPPYLLGYWLGDGDRDCPRITAHRDDIPSLVAQCERLGVELGEPRPTHGETFRMLFGRGWAKVALRDAGLLLNKHIPQRLLRSSLEQRWELLRGLVDSDGTVSRTGTVEVSLCDLRLADDVFELAVSLGLMPTRTDGPAKLNGRIMGTRARIRFTAARGETVSRLPRKLDRTRQARRHARPFSRSRTVASIEREPVAPARCITVEHPSHQYLVGDRNIPTCNSGKSPFAAAMALAEFCGPVRLLDFDADAPGGCVGREVDMPLVQIAATAESQTANTMRMVRAFAPKGSALVEKYELDPGKTRYYKLPEGTLEVITSSATSAEGGEGSFIVADETEHWKPANGGAELSATLADNLAKSGSRMLETSNAWVPGMQTVAEETWDAWLAQEEGRTRGKTRILYDATIAPAETDLADPESLRAALEHVYADCPWVDVTNIMERIWSPRAKPDDSKRKYLNRPTAAQDSWISPEQWSVLARPDIRVEDGAEIALFFDGSKSQDATALIGCEIESGHVFTLGVWEPDQNDDSDTVDVADVDRVVRRTFERYDVAAFFADVKEWESYALTEWPSRYADDLIVWAAPSSRPPQAIAWDMRGHKIEFARAAEACHEEIVAEREVDDEIVKGEFTHDGDARVARHMGNARRRPYQQYVSIGKESPDSPKKVDAAVCVIGVRMVRRLVLASPKRRKKRSGKAIFA